MDEKHQKAFLKAMKEMVEKKGISEDVIVDAISEAFKVAYNKKISDEMLIVNKPIKLRRVKKVKDENGNVQTEVDKLSDALISCNINLKEGKIETFREYKVVKDEDLTDDFIEISDEDERATSNNLKVGDYYKEPLSFDDFSKGDVNRFISTYKAKINKAEKESLLESFSSKIGNLVTGVVEKADSHCVLVDLGKISITLYQKDLIGKETFKPGDIIKMYVVGISKDDTKGGSLIKCSRSCPEYLAKVFQEEVHEIYDGTVKIYKIARMAGVRSKVAVYSEDPNVDAQGACIGQNGQRIQEVVKYLGNDKNAKEKIDIIQYSPVLGVFLRECLKPGIVIGAKIEELPDGKKKAIAVCENETAIAAIGVKGVNVILARQLCSLDELLVYDQSKAEEEKLDFEPMAYFEEKVHELEKEKFRIESMKNAELNASRPIVDEVKPVVSDDEYLDKELDFENAHNLRKVLKNDEIKEEKVEEKPLAKEEKVERTKAEEVKPAVKPVEVKRVEENKLREVVQEAPAKKISKVVEPVEHREVKTTTTLDALEASLEEEKKNEKQHAVKSKKDKKTKKEKEETQDIKPIVDDKNRMSIYTDEELAEMDENEDWDNSDDSDEDYSEYDSDDYYDK